MENNAIDGLFSSELRDIEVEASGKGWKKVDGLLGGRNRNSLWVVGLLFLGVVVLFSAVLYKYRTIQKEPVYDVSQPMASDHINNVDQKSTLNRVEKGEESAELRSAQINSRDDVVKGDKKKNIRSVALMDEFEAGNTALSSEEFTSSSDLEVSYPSVVLPTMNSIKRVNSRQANDLAIRTIQVINANSTDLPRSRTLVVNLSKKPKRDTVILSAPKPDQEPKKSVLASIREVSRDGNIIQKVRTAKNNLFNKEK